MHDLLSKRDKLIEEVNLKIGMQTILEKSIEEISIAINNLTQVHKISNDSDLVANDLESLTSDKNAANNQIFNIQYNDQEGLNKSKDSENISQSIQAIFVFNDDDDEEKIDASKQKNSAFNYSSILKGLNMPTDQIFQHAKVNEFKANAGDQQPKAKNADNPIKPQPAEPEHQAEPSSRSYGKH